MFAGPGENYAFLGDAGNFAYAAVSANIGVPLMATDLAAGAYTLVAHPVSDLGPYGMDPSARFSSSWVRCQMQESITLAGCL